MRRYFTFLLVFVAGCNASEPLHEHDYRKLILSARIIAESYGEEVWPGFSRAPFGVLIVDGEREWLFCHVGATDNFEPAPHSDLLDCPVYSRAASFSADIAASFPAVGGVPTIVIGTPAGTGKDDDQWIQTLLHEHFHQMQYSAPGYYDGTAALDLSGGDDSGMWMLNYPFPYEDPATVAAFKTMSQALLQALEARGEASFDDALRTYLHARTAARASVSASDWRYLELQFWQEGVARWSEVAITAHSLELHGAARVAEERIVNELRGFDLATQARTAFYPLGAGEAALLNVARGPQWRSDYWDDPFALGRQLAGAID